MSDKTAIQRRAELTRFAWKAREELSRRAWEAVDSLVRTLGGSLDLRETVQRSLHTVAGQLLVRRAAFFLLNEDRDRFELVDCVGVRRERLPLVELPVTTLPADTGRGEDGAIVFEDLSLGPLSEYFKRAVPISDGTEAFGLLLVGERLGRRHRHAEDEQLLTTMGAVIGASVKRTMAYENLAESNRRLESVHRMQKQILDHVTHEFNTPLTVLRCTLDLVSSESEEDRRECAAMQQEALERLESLIAGVLEVAKAETDCEPAELLCHGDILEECLPIIEASPWCDGGLRVFARIEDSVSMRVQRQDIRDVLGRLLANAWEFARDGERHCLLGTYVVPRQLWEGWNHEARIERFAAWVQQNDHQADPPGPFSGVLPELPEGATDAVLLIETLDLGIGIPQGEIDLVFEPFAQGSNSPRHSVSGAGMGLNSSRRQVAELGGELVAHSVEGLGSLFSIVLPLRMAPV